MIEVSFTQPIEEMIVKPTKRPVGRPRRDVPENETYLQKCLVRHRENYHNKKQLKERFKCAFVNYRGESCPKTSFQTHCSVHRKLLESRAKNSEQL